MAKCTCRKVTGGCCYEFYLEQTEHGVAYVEAMPPVVVGDITVTLPHCVHPPCQRLTGKESWRRHRKRMMYTTCVKRKACGPNVAQQVILRGLQELIKSMLFQRVY